MKALRAVFDTFEAALEVLVTECQKADAYMPGLATRLRLYADDLADRFPDDTNQGPFQ
jgi:hypothetical protein